ncbi:uncharacterized protein LOC114315410 isoform X2 [Camellia sinensis]|uniref:uncharacterized protein LOC114315410 isoform X2 n=1 Tax=Camellia sinensis TaxID=4442 RepID=UPI001035D9AD|nr:uncharacterized protein LOC114315410 isoform X2 [Camellia sinensis]
MQTNQNQVVLVNNLGKKKRKKKKIQDFKIPSPRLPIQAYGSRYRKREEKKRETRRCLLTLSAAAILPPADSLAAAIYAADIENRVREREEEEREETLPPDAPPPQPSCRRRRPAAADSRKIQDIVMYVNSPGGSVTAGLAIFDTMRHIRPDVSTVCVGLAASMGAFLLSSGTKGKRYSLPNSRIMIHQPLGGAQGGQTDIDIQANEMLHH